MSGLAHALKSVCGVAVLSTVFSLSLLVSTQAEAAVTLPEQGGLDAETGTFYTFTLGEATGGTGDLTYTLARSDGGGLPPGLMFNADTRTLSGTPTMADGGIGIELIYKVTDSASPTAMTDMQTFRIGIIPATVITANAGPDQEMVIAGSSVTLNGDGSTITGTREQVYLWTQVENGSPRVSLNNPNFESTSFIAPSGISEVTTLTFTLTVSIEDHRQLMSSDTVEITVNPVPLALPEVEDKTYTVGERFSITLPPASGGTGTYTYTLTDADGTISFDSDSLIFSETPEESDTKTTPYTVMVTYRVTDTATPPNAAQQTFMVTVMAAGLSEENIQQLNEAIAPRLVQSAVASTIASLGNRIDIAFSGIPQTASYQLDGQSIQLDGKTSLSNNLQATLLQKLPSHARALADGTMDWKHALGNSSFALPLNATDGAGTGTNLAVWGSGNYTKLSGDGDVDWDGDVVSVQLGVDNRVRDVLVGGMLSWSEGDFDYTQNALQGEYNHKITSIHPYLAWSSAGINLWSSVGYGQGKLELKEETRTTETDTKLLSLAAGVKGAISDKPGFSIKSDIALVRTDIDARDNIIPEQRIDSQRLRVLLEVEEEHRATSGGVFKPVVELGLRYDGGDGDTGVGALLGAGVRYTNASGLSAQGKLHTLIGRDDYKEWGISGVIRQQTGVGGRGLAFSLRPSYGPSNSSDTTAAGTDTLWEQNQSADKQSATDYSMRMNADISYGLSAPGGRGLLIPYSEATLGDVNRYRLGLRWKRHSWLDMNLFGEEQAGKHTVLVESRIRF